MTNINLAHDNYSDYVASEFFAALNVENLTLTPKYAPQTDKNPVPAILVHVSGMQRGTGLLVNFDMWPRYDFEEEDLKKFFDEKFHLEEIKDKDGKPVMVLDENGKPTDEVQTKKVIDGYEAKGNFADIHFRIGYWVETDGKEKVVREGKPKWLAYISNGQVCKLSGDAREFNGQTL
jgi:hypothetical protein